jgi:flagellin FlaB
MKSSSKNDSGFTGLEAAIVLIAFVVVAAVFSYVVLGAGFFTTQKAQTSVHTSVSQATSAVELSGPVTINTSDANRVGNISFYLQLAAGGNAVDMSKVIYTVSTSERTETVDAANPAVSLLWVKENTDHNSNKVLNPREMVLVDLGLNWPTTDMTKNQKFMVEVKPPVGASYPIERTLPPALAAGKSYEVY